MKKLALLLLFVSISPGYAQLTYWVHPTCTNAPGNRFQNALNDALRMARRGNMRLQSATDTDQAALFQRIWKQPKTDQPTRQQVHSILGMPQIPPQPAYGIAGMIPEPNNNRLAANVRYYCDDDPQIVQGGSRWTLRKDPNPAPQGYVEQAKRPRVGTQQPGQAYQEWEDVANGIIMGRTGGCKDDGTQAETFDIRTPGGPPPGQPAARATVTLCNLQLNSILHSFGDLPLKADLTKRINRPRGRQGVDAFGSMTSLVLLHESAHLPTIGIHDQPSPNPRPPDHDTAYGWLDVQDLASTADSLDNSDNYAFFSLLAVLADRHFRLSKKDSEAHDGKLVYDLHGITSRKGRKEKEKKRRGIEEMQGEGLGERVKGMVKEKRGGNGGECPKGMRSADGTGRICVELRA